MLQQKKILKNNKGLRLVQSKLLLQKYTCIGMSGAAEEICRDLKAIKPFSLSRRKTLLNLLIVPSKIQPTYLLNVIQIYMFAEHGR
jgi:hypothetical protein